MGELVEGPLDAEVGGEGEREDDHLGGHVAAGVVADQQHRPLLGHVAEVADLGRGTRASTQPRERQVLADVVGVAVVEVGGRPSEPGAPPRRAASPATCGRRRCSPPPARARPSAGASGARAGRGRRRGPSAVAAVASRRSASPARRASVGSAMRRCYRGPSVRLAGAAGSAKRRGASARGSAAQPGRLADSISSADQAVGLLGQLDLGHVAALARAPPAARLGSASATWRAKAAGTSRSESPQMNSAGGSSSARRVQKPRSPYGSSR